MEIKFRAFCKSEKMMMREKRLCGIISNYYGLTEKEWSDYIWMQFTGLKDKNGEEVYQGDILKITADKEGYGHTSYGGFAVVESETCGYDFKVFNPTEAELEEEWRNGGDGFDSVSLWHTDDPNNIEIIGNIYENPELLEV